MLITQFTKPKAIVTIIFALIFLVDANLLFTYFGTELDSGGIMVARILGGAYLGAGIGFWKINSPKDISSASARSYGLSDGLGAIACLIATLNGEMNALGWLLVVAFAFYACGFLMVAKKIDNNSFVAAEPLTGN